MIDVAEQINAVRREVGNRVLEAGEARTLTISQTYQASLEDVWDACTDADRIQRWFLPVTGELQLNGRYKLEGNAEGTIESCDPPRSFRATWEYAGEVSWIEVRLVSEAEERTRLELEHIAHVDDDRWAQFGPGAVGIGWDMALMGLAEHMGGAAPVDHSESMAWMMSDDGRRFMAMSSEQWRDASIAAGEDGVAAHAAAERVTEFYTAPPEEPAT